MVRPAPIGLIPPNSYTFVVQVLNHAVTKCKGALHGAFLFRSGCGTSMLIHRKCSTASALINSLTKLF